jgi:hypothetical protein
MLSLRLELRTLAALWLPVRAVLSGILAGLGEWAYFTLGRAARRLDTLFMNRDLVREQRIGEI